MKEKVKSLWKLCFDDDEQFIEMYFRLRYTDEINVAIEHEGRVASALQMIPYPMTFCGNIVPTAYMSGVCTHPDFRSRGMMRTLLSQAFSKMHTNGILFSTLIPAEPWLFDYYARVGYATTFSYSTKETVLIGHTPSDKINVNDAASQYCEDIYPYLNKKLSARTCCIQHTPEDFQVIRADLAISDGILFTAKKGNEVCGLAVVYKGDDYIVVNELLADTKEIEYTLLYYINQYAECKRVIELSPPEEDLVQHPLGMARIIDAKAVLQMYATAFPEEEMLFELQDSLLPANNGYYQLRAGKCAHSANPFSDAHIPIMSVAALTKRILLPLKPYMSLMLN